MDDAKTLGIISIKGGVGKTSTVAALGAALTNDFGKKVLLIDANFSAPNLALHFGIVKPEKTLHDVLNRNSHPSKAIHKTGYNFDIIPGSLLPAKINPFNLKESIHSLKKDYDIILIDSSPSLNEEILATMIASDELIVVTTPDYPTLSTTLRAVKIARERKTPILGLVLNKVRNKKFEISLKEIEEATGVNVLAVLPDETGILEALANAVPSTIYKSKSNSTIEYKKLAAALIGSEYKDKRLKTKIKEFFVGNLKKQEINRSLIKAHNYTSGHSNSL